MMRKILLIEDDRSIVRLLELEHRGFETEIACNGPSGLAAAREGEYARLYHLHYNRNESLLET